MATYVVAGRADDPSFARVEHAARQLQAACPNVFVHYEMKHPDAWREFIVGVYHRYDFNGLAEDFGGPLVWTHEGELIGSGPEFVQRVCVEKYGMREPPSLTDPRFKAIAADNLKQVRLALHRQEHGPSLAERCESACVRAEKAGLLVPEVFCEKRRITSSGVTAEVWVADGLAARWVAQREAAGQPTRLDARLQVGEVGGDPGSHALLLHPTPLTRSQLVLVPQRLAREVEASPDVGAQMPPPEAGEEPQEAVQEAPGAAEAEPCVPLADLVAAAGPRLLEVLPREVRARPGEDLGPMDFLAAVEVLLGLGGVATWTGLSEGSEFRQPLDTHLQVLGFPLHSQGDTCPLRHPFELLCDATLREGGDTLRLLPFPHWFGPLPFSEGLADEKKKNPNNLAKALVKAYDDAKVKFGHGSCAIAFTTVWFAYLPLEPPAVASPLHEVWLQLPPPHAVALCGLVVAPSVARGFPETAGLQVGAPGKLVSSRAAEEGIPEGTPEYEAASREVRIAARILDCPAELIGIWAKAQQ